uniref:Ig-like domain-containing protein n=1 Tax=Monopterus albus TaxID=43700 RepID=A0A3Q3J1E2_MONAL
MFLEPLVRVTINGLEHLCLIDSGARYSTLNAPLSRSRRTTSVIGFSGMKEDNLFNKTPRITVKQEPGTFVLHILKAQLSDTAFYYCEKLVELRRTFLNITFLRVKGKWSHFPSDPVRPGDLVTLQCSVLFDNKTCLQEHSVYWFRARSDDSHPSVIYAHLNSGDHCERSPEISSSQKCVYNLSRNVSSSDAGTYYCAVATCGEILFGSGTKLEVEGNHLIVFCWNVYVNICFLIMFSHIFIQTAEDSLVYSVPNFARRKAGHDVRRDSNVAEGQSIYADVRVLE